METRSYIKNLDISPKKLRFLLPGIKSLTPMVALDELMYMPKKPARILYSAIKSAVDNAKNVLKADPSQLKFKLLTVEEGPRLKRFRAGGRGTAAPFVKRKAHLKIVLETKEIKSEARNPKVETNTKPKLPIKKKKISGTKSKS